MASTQPASAYIQDIKGAIEDASAEGDGVGPQPESLLAHLAARGLIVVHVPPGADCTFLGGLQS